MLIRLVRTARRRAAVTLALAYVLCVLAPPVVHAFSGDWAATHLTAGHNHYGISDYVRGANAPAHSEGTAHHGVAHDHAMQGHASHNDAVGGDADGQDRPSGCCMYFCVSAMPASPTPDIIPIARIVPAVASVDRGIAGRGPPRIDRPPIVLLPV